MSANANKARARGRGIRGTFRCANAALKLGFAGAVFEVLK